MTGEKLILKSYMIYTNVKSVKKKMKVWNMCQDSEAATLNNDTNST